MDKIKDLLINEVRRRLFDEGIPRIKHCLSKLTDEEVWYRPNGNSNSVGNLVLHLCGNVRQWVLTGLDNQDDIRQRQSEFSEAGPISRQELSTRLGLLQMDVEAFLNRMPNEVITKIVRVQGYNETGLSVLIHVVEHFSYHVGQITYFTKMKKDIDTGYYSGQDLEITGQ